MPRARKRRTPIVRVETAIKSSNTPRSGRTIIRQFHALLKRQVQLQNTQTADATTLTALADIQYQITKLGGLEYYQQISAVGQGNDRGGGSEKILIRWLKEVGIQKRSIKLRLLEVGALKPDNYRSCSSWIDPVPIDIRSRHPSILEQDFLLLDERENHEKWDLISLSLVLNFIPEAKDRGHALHLAHNILVPGGHLFLTLPLSCVANSRYLDFERLKALMQAIGFIQVCEKWRERGKMAYWLYQKVASPISPVSFGKKTVLRQGNRNNFCILL